MTDDERATLSDDQRAVLDDYAEYLCNDCGGERTCGYCETLRTLADALTQLARSRASEARLAAQLEVVIAEFSPWHGGVSCSCARCGIIATAQAALDAAGKE